MCLQRYAQYDAVLTAYDAMITFDVELEVVWKRKPNLVSVLHVLNRYPQLAALVSTLVLSFPFSDAVRRFIPVASDTSGAYLPSDQTCAHPSGSH